LTGSLTTDLETQIANDYKQLDELMSNTFSSVKKHDCEYYTVWIGNV